MTRFLLLIRADDTEDAGPPPPDLLDAMQAYRRDTSAGRIVDDSGLTASADATVFRAEAGAVTVTDGPYAEAKEVVGGFLLVEATSRDQAAVWAKGFVATNAEHWPGLTYSAELRELVEGSG